MDINDLIDGFFKYFRRRSVAFDDALPALEELGFKNIGLAFFSDVPYGMPRAFVVEDLENAGLGHVPGALYTSVDVGYRKPDPRTLLAVCDEIGVDPSRAAYVGNEKKDVVAARRAQLTSILLDRGGQDGNDFGQHFTITSLGSLLSKVG